jgi:hypothetical protein
MFWWDSQSSCGLHRANLQMLFPPLHRTAQQQFPAVNQLMYVDADKTVAA